MRSLHLTDAGQETVLTERDTAQPQPTPGEVLIRVFAAGVTPTELIWYPTSHAKDGSRRTGAVPCHEFSGVVAGLGAGVSSLSIGQEVYGMNDWFAEGALAEYCLSRPEWIARKPRRLDYVQAASVPIGALTARQGLFDRANLRAGERVLVHGGAGSVGIYAVQLAHSRGAYVTATASADHLAFVESLGADNAIDYRTGTWEGEAREADVIFDAVGGQTLRRSWDMLKPGGRLVTIAADSEGTRDERTQQAFFIVEPRRSQLAEIADLIDAGTLRAVVDAVVPWARASDAFAGKVERTRRGKMVVAVAAAGQGVASKSRFS
ncbi:MAG TPA: NADP-dependent oxidoreductase [Bryobacteraceae bacterium]|nr:NADP-dependent oxidoreductase [Bryobacteraceae bacterium]